MAIPDIPGPDESAYIVINNKIANIIYIYVLF
jgi:hypothetical protein